MLSLSLDRYAGRMRATCDQAVGPAGKAIQLPAGRPDRPRWRFVALARIANFPLLRRYLGSARADELAGECAALLGQVLAEARPRPVARDTVEFAFEGDRREALEDALRRLDRVFAQPVELDGERYELELLFGIAATDGAHWDDVRMVEEAELALADATAERRCVVRDVARSQRAVDRIALARDLKRAIANGELFLQYQPKMHVRRQEVTSIEALIRWQHPARGLILPGDFIPLAEETRAITALTLWTIRQALADQAMLAGQGHDLPIFVNIAGVLLSDARFVRDACELVAARSNRIGFEITETSVIRDPESAIANLQVFADLGVAIAIDDYGAGLSSLAYLKRLPARELKIDKLFVTQLTSSNRDPLIVRSTIDLAHALEMEVVAEGVETQAALALLSVMGCDMVQGYLISRPIGLNALTAFLDEGRHAAEETRASFNRLASAWKRA
jgi:diguanylate cyclase